MLLIISEDYDIREKKGHVFFIVKYCFDIEKRYFIYFLFNKNKRKMRSNINY